MVINKYFEVKFYQESSGKVPVREWLKEFNKDDRKEIDRDIKYTQYTWPWTMPVVKPLGNGLFEIRTKLKNRQVRIFYVLENGLIVLLHGIVKKTQQTPRNDLELAQKRAKQVKRNK